LVILFLLNSDLTHPLSNIPNTYDDLRSTLTIQKNDFHRFYISIDVIVLKKIINSLKKLYFKYYAVQLSRTGRKGSLISTII